MYCKNCNSYNDDNSRFCNQCGAELEKETEQNTAFESEHSAQADGRSGEYTDQYSQPYSQPYYQQQPQYSHPSYNGPAEPTAPLNNTMSIIAIVLNVVIFNILGIVFAVLSLTNYNGYESALRAGNLALSEQLKAKSKKYSKVAIILCVVVAVISILAIVAAIICGTFFVLEHNGEVISNLDPEFFDEFEVFSETVVPSVSSYIS